MSENELEAPSLPSTLLKIYLTGRFGAAPGDSESGRTVFWLCSCGPSCELALRLVPSRGACAGIAPDEGAARSGAMRAPDGSWAKLGGAATDAAPITASAAIV